MHLRQNPATLTQCRQNHLQHHRQQVLLPDCRDQALPKSAHHQEQRRDARRPDPAKRLQPKKIGSATRIKARLTISVRRAYAVILKKFLHGIKIMFNFVKT